MNKLEQQALAEASANPPTDEELDGVERQALAFVDSSDHAGLFSDDVLRLVAEIPPTPGGQINVDL